MQAPAAPPSELSRPGPRALAAAAVTVILWASAFPGIRAGLESYTPASLALLRYLVASAVLAVYALLTRMPLPRLRDLPGLFLCGFLGFAYYNVALNAGELRVPAGMASFIIAAGPVFIALEALLLRSERLRPAGWLGIALSFAGVAVISLVGESGFALSLHALLILSAALASATYAVIQKRFLQSYGVLPFLTYAIWTGTLLLLVFAPGLLRDLRAASPTATWAVVYMGIFPGAIGYGTWSYVLSRLPAAVAGSFLYLIPVLAALMAWLWLGEMLPGSAILGGALVIAGVVAVNRGK
jgi:drug/metabolite transporter (DMT)-like permease